MDRFDYSSIEFPADIDYEELLNCVREDNTIIERIVDQYLQNDPKWLENERQITQLRQEWTHIAKDLDVIDKNNKEFSEVLKEMGGIQIEERSIDSTVHCNNGLIYYSKPIQRVIDIEELRTRMNSKPKIKTSVKTELIISKINETSKSSQTTDSSDTKQEVFSSKDEIKKENKPIMQVNSAQQSTDSVVKRARDASQLINANKLSACAPKTVADCDDILFEGIRKRKDIKKIPKPGLLVKEQLKAGDSIYAACFGIITKPWREATVIKTEVRTHFTIKFKETLIAGGNFISGKLIAMKSSPTVQLQTGERVIALVEEESKNVITINNQYVKKEFYSGTVAEPPKNTNSYRYLIFFDKNAFRYVDSEDIRVIYEKNKNQWEEVPQEIDQEYAQFIKSYLESYPERPMLRLQIGDKVRVRYFDKWEIGKVIDIDCSLVLISFERHFTTEWLYRGSRRFQDIYNEVIIRDKPSTVKHRAGRSTTRICRRLAQRESNVHLEWTEDLPEEEDSKQSKSDDDEIVILDADVCRKKKTKQTARKSTAKNSGYSSSSSCDTYYVNENEHKNTIIVDVVRMPYFDRKLKPYETHQCGPHCIRVAEESRKFVDENPYHIPIIVGYRREIVRYSTDRPSQIIYRAPCGRRLRAIYEVWNYLRLTDSVLDIDLFTFSVKNVLFRKSDPLKARFHIPDISHGLEPQPISCVNTVDDSNLGNVKYHNVRFPHPDVKRFNIDPDFLSCCECPDNCLDSENCPCQQLTVETAEAVRKYKPENPGYEYKRLHEFIMTGVFECNEKCSCKSQCPNRVVQNGIKCRLQLFKTLKKGWGVRVLHDVPRGAFLCIYAAQILNEEVADKEGKTFGDEYLADLDYIDVCEHHKEGYESGVEDDDEDYHAEEDDDDYQEEDNSSDEDYRYSSKIKRSNAEFEASLEDSSSAHSHNVRRRNDDKNAVSYSIREDFFKEDFSYSLDAKKIGNIGRYLNHSCEPNCFVQNVFVDTHDLRFPWVSFFAKKDIPAFEELTWDYNYEIGSIPGRKMACYCGASKCRKRLL